VVVVVVWCVCGGRALCVPLRGPFGVLEISTVPAGFGLYSGCRLGGEGLWTPSEPAGSVLSGSFSGRSKLVDVEAEGQLQVTESWHLWRWARFRWHVLQCVVYGVLVERPHYRGCVLIAAACSRQ
jgi:hypothetical protein